MKGLINVRDEIGYIKHSFILSFYFLLVHSDEVINIGDNFYQSAMRLIIRQGGETNTNACIAGTMLGALVGIK